MSSLLLDSLPSVASIRFGSWSWTLLVGALNGFVVAALLLRSNPGRAANRLLAALVAVVALRLVPYILGYAGAYDAYPWLSFAPFDLPLAMGPLLWLYVETLTQGRMPPRWAWHLAPAALHGVAAGLVFVLCTVPQKSWVDVHVMRWLSPLIGVGALVALGVYALLALRRHQRYQRWLDEMFSNREAYRLGWLRTTIVLFLVTAMVGLGFQVVDLLVRPLDYYDEFPLYLWLAGLCYALGLIAWRASTTVYPVLDTHLPTDPSLLPDRETASIVVPTASPAQPIVAPSADRAATDWHAMARDWAQRIEREELWRDPQLTLPLLARTLGTNATYLSRALNVGLGASFNRHVNRLRAEWVASRLRDGDSRDLIALAMDAGFASKASFQRAFREHVGGTPSEYREGVRRDERHGMP